jgi:hypothetical protein
MPVARLARLDDLPSLLALYEVSEVSAHAEPRERAESIWQRTLTQPGVRVFVSDAQTRIAATCMLVVAPNLLRGAGATGFWRTWSLIPSYEAEVMGKPWFKPR